MTSGCALLSPSGLSKDGDAVPCEPGMFAEACCMEEQKFIHGLFAMLLS